MNAETAEPYYTWRKAMNKEQFVEALGLLLSNAGIGVKGAKYEFDKYHEMAIIEFHERPEYIVNITGCSNVMIMSEVTRSIGAYIGY